MSYIVMVLFKNSRDLLWRHDNARFLPILRVIIELACNGRSMSWGKNDSIIMRLNCRNHGWWKSNKYSYSTFSNIYFHSFSTGRCGCNLKLLILKLISRTYFLHIFPVKLPWGEYHRTSLIIWWLFNTGSGNDLVPSCNKPVPVPILTQIYGPNMASLSHNDFHCQTSNISHTKSQKLNVSCLVLQLSLPNPLKPGVK